PSDMHCALPRDGRRPSSQQPLDWPRANCAGNKIVPRSADRPGTRPVPDVSTPLGETTEVASTNDIKNGTTLKLEHGVLWNVLEFQHVKPGKGGAFVRTKLKNVTTGKTVDKTFNAGAKIEFANVDRSEMEYLYSDGESFIFMDTSTYDQIPVPETIVGDYKNFLLENTKVTVATYEGNPLYIELPPAVSSRSSRPIRVCRATVPRAAPSPPPCRPAPPSRYLCSSPPVSP